MIRVDEQHNLVLTPRAFAPNEGKDILIPLNRGYVCPTCESLIYGTFTTDRGEDSLLNLNPFAVGNEHTAVRPEYKTKFMRLPTGEKFQFFYDEHHCGEGTLQKRVAKSESNQCKFVKFYYEPSFRRLFNRVLKDLKDLELYGGHVHGIYYKDHEAYLKGIRETLRDRPESLRLFLAHFPYGRFVLDVTGQGPACYVAMYRYEHTLIRQFYEQVIEGSHECLHQNQN